MDKNWDSEWIHFRKKTRRGIFVLLTFFILVAFVPRIYEHFFYNPPKVEYELTLNASDYQEFLAEDNSEKRTFNPPTELFNPNEYTYEQWMAIGMTEKQAKSVLNYREKVGEFKYKSDLKKLYVMSDDLYETLFPMIDLPEHKFEKVKDKPLYTYKWDTINRFQTNSFAPTSKFESETKEVYISINSATQGELQTIKGIGPFFAKEIIKVRDEFGGFVSFDQLKVIYNMTQEKIDEIAPFLYIDETKIRKININNAQKEELDSHPWISADLANSIIYFRENYKAYTSLDELLLSPYVDKAFLKKISPYLTVGQEELSNY